MRATVREGGNEVSAMSDRAVTAARRSVKGDGEAGGKRPEPIRVLIADDHALFRRGLEMVLEAEDDIALVGQASDGTEAVTVAGESLPDVVLMDIRMPKTSGIEACRATKEVAPSAKIVMLTISDEEEDLFEAIRAGASGYLLKDIPLDEVAQTLRSLAAGRLRINASIAGHARASSDLRGLGVRLATRRPPTGRPAQKDAAASRPARNAARQPRASAILRADATRAGQARASAATRREACSAGSICSRRTSSQPTQLAASRSAWAIGSAAPGPSRDTLRATRVLPPPARPAPPARPPPPRPRPPK